MKNRIYLFTTIAVSFLIIGATCRKNCDPKKYSFLSTVTANPDLDSIHINDTLWIEMNVPVIFIDQISGNTVTYDNAENLSTVIQVGKFIGGSVSNPGTIDADNEFSYRIISGIEIGNTNAGVITEIKPQKNNNRYLIKCGIIPKSQGIFGLSISNAANVFQTGNSCDKAFFEITFSNTNQHLYYYQQNRPGYLISEYETKHLYCFKVY